MLIGTTLVEAAPPDATPSTTPAAGIGIRLLDYPHSQAGDPRDHEYIVQTVKPGTTLTRHIQITNTTSMAQAIEIKITGATIDDGHFNVAGDARNQLAKWTSTNVDTVRLRSNTHSTITATIHVPEKATRGEQYGVIWAQLRATATTPTHRVSVINRVGIRAYINVDTKKTPPAFTLGPISVDRDNTGAPVLQTTATNTGETAVDLTGRARLANGPGHTSAGPYETTATTTLAPGQQANVRIPTAPQLAAGTWTATIKLRSGDTTRKRTDTITIPHQHRAPPRPAKQTKPSHPIAVPVGITIGLILAIAVTASILIRRARKHRTHE
ncbi:hypothetical protein [Microlunatus endophyticus]|nr:hypothetical protein [Microlunatus endophyticus]